MALIRLFGPRKSGATAPFGEAPTVATIAAVWDALSTASVSVTWRCRHSGAVIVGEGAVDFTAHASRMSVVSGKRTAEYLRAGGTAYRLAAGPGIGSTTGDDVAVTAWESFPEVDVCGPHAYANPETIARAVRSCESVTTRRPEAIDGAPLIPHQVTAKPKPADPDKHLARLARHLRDHGANTLVLSAFTDLDGEITRLRLELPHWTPADNPTADHHVTLDLHEFGTDVEITAPDPASVTRRRTPRSCADLTLL
jgi:hypothetical protein